MEGKMAELERRETAARAADADRAADRPRPMELAPQDELRSVAVEAKLAYEAQLRRELECARRQQRDERHAVVGQPIGGREPRQARCDHGLHRRGGEQRVKAEVQCPGDGQQRQAGRAG